MILVCISRITDPNFDRSLHNVGYMLWLQDRSKENIGFNTDFWRGATDMEEQLYHQGVRNLLTAIKKVRL